MDESREVVYEAVLDCLDRGVKDNKKIQNAIRDSLGGYVWKKTQRRPMILPIIMEVSF